MFPKNDGFHLSYAHSAYGDNCWMSAKPVILILRTQSARTDRIEPLLWGIEEEGVPFEVREVIRCEYANELAKQAAQNSALNVGIVVNGAEEIILHHRDLPVGMPLFAFSDRFFEPVRLRRLGTNAGRLAKGQPLLLDD